MVRCSAFVIVITRLWVGVWAVLWAVLWAVPVQADSLCGVTDADAVLARIDGTWDVIGAVAVDTSAESFVVPIDGDVRIYDFGLMQTSLSGERGPDISLDVARDPFDVDKVDDYLDTVEAPWIADAVSETPCGPEGLLQFEGDYRADALSENGYLTLIPYFDDQIVMVVEVETRTEVGLAFVSIVTLLTRSE